MGDRDVALVERLGIPVQQVAKALSKSRQTVTRGIKSPSPYLKPKDLLTALTVWKDTDAGLYAVAKSAICEVFPELTEAVLASNGPPKSFAMDVAAEYWFLCGDLVQFRMALPACYDQFSALCSLEIAQVKIFVNPRDQRAAQRFEIRHQETQTQVIICDNVDLRLVPSTLLRMDMDGNVDLFGPSDSGFAPLSRSEAARLRGVVHDLLPH